MQKNIGNKIEKWFAEHQKGGFQTEEREKTVCKGKSCVFTHGNEKKLEKKRIPVRSRGKWLNIFMIH